MIKELKGIIRKADIVLAAVLVVICVSATFFVSAAGSDGAKVVIEVENKVYGTYRLSEDQIIDIDTDRGHNQLVIKDGRAYMNEADCPDGYCTHQHRNDGGICRSDQTLICLPNRVVVTVESTETADVDAVAGTPDGGGTL